MARRLFTIACWIAHLVVIWPGRGGETTEGNGTLPVRDERVAPDADGAGPDRDRRGALRDDERRWTTSFDELCPRFAPDLGRTR